MQKPIKGVDAAAMDVEARPRRCNAPQLLLLREEVEVATDETHTAQTWVIEKGEDVQPHLIGQGGEGGWYVLTTAAPSFSYTGEHEARNLRTQVCSVMRTALAWRSGLLRRSDARRMKHFTSLDGLPLLFGFYETPSYSDRFDTNPHQTSWFSVPLSREPALCSVINRGNRISSRPLHFTTPATRVHLPGHPTDIPLDAWDRVREIMVVLVIIISERSNKMSGRISRVGGDACVTVLVDGVRWVGLRLRHDLSLREPTAPTWEKVSPRGGHRSTRRGGT